MRRFRSFQAPSGESQGTLETLSPWGRWLFMHLASPFAGKPAPCYKTLPPSRQGFSCLGQGSLSVVTCGKDVSERTHGVIIRLACSMQRYPSERCSAFRGGQDALAHRFATHQTFVRPRERRTGDSHRRVASLRGWRRCCLSFALRLRVKRGERPGELIDAAADEGPVVLVGPEWDLMGRSCLFAFSLTPRFRVPCSRCGCAGSRLDGVEWVEWAPWWHRFGADTSRPYCP